MSFTYDDVFKVAEHEFPYETPNPGQLEAITQAVLHLLNNEQHVIIEAPTGVGKSVIAYTIHKTLESIQSVTQRTTILTHTKALQDQYRKDFKHISILKGRSNYSCHLSAGPYGSTSCIKACKSSGCNPQTQCPYVKRRDAWMAQDSFAITNYDYAILASMQKMTETFGKEHNLVVFDECHELRGKIIDNYKLNLVRSDIAVLQGHKSTNMIFESTLGLMSMLNDDHPVSKTPIKLSESIVERATKLEGLITKVHSELAKDDPLKDHLLMLYNQMKFITLVNTSNEVVVMECEPGKIEIRVLYAHVVSNEAIFNKAGQFVHMSATIAGHKVYAEQLGLKTYKYIEVSNPISVDRRKVYIINRFAIGSKFNDWNKYYSLIDALANKYKGVNGIVHAPSFALLKQIKENVSTSTSSRMLISNNREEILNELEMESGKIVLGASLSTGYDFKDDLARWQIISKVPYPYLGDPWIKVIVDRHPKMYAREAVLTLIQSAGRVCRGVDDKGITYILDSNILRLLNNDIDLFPDWFLEAIEIVK